MKSPCPVHLELGTHAEEKVERTHHSALIHLILVFCFFPPSLLPGTNSSALQGAISEACRAAEKGRWITAGGGQSLSFLRLWAARLAHTLHHSGADLCLTLLNPHDGHRSWTLPVRRCHTAVISRFDTLPPKVRISSICYCICISHRSCRACLQQKCLSQTTCLQPYVFLLWGWEDT